MPWQALFDPNRNERMRFDMAKASLSVIWLKANDEKASWRKPRQGVLSAKKRRSSREPIIYDPLDQIALTDLKVREGRVRRSRLSDEEYNKRNMRGSEFVLANVGYSEQQCLLMPRVPHDVSTPFAREMCALVNGSDVAGDMVARHLCGNGHWSCVNPLHLAWGTVEQNARDRVLHRSQPRYMPELSEAQTDFILESPRHSNVVAVLLDIHSVVVRKVRGYLV